MLVCGGRIEESRLHGKGSFAHRPITIVEMGGQIVGGIYENLTDLNSRIMEDWGEEHSHQKNFLCVLDVISDHPERLIFNLAGARAPPG